MSGICGGFWLRTRNTSHPQTSSSPSSAVKVNDQMVADLRRRMEEMKHALADKDRELAQNSERLSNCTANSQQDRHRSRGPKQGDERAGHGYDHWNKWRAYVRQQKGATNFVHQPLRGSIVLPRHPKGCHRQVHA